MGLRDRNICKCFEKFDAKFRAQCCAEGVDGRCTRKLSEVKTWQADTAGMIDNTRLSCEGKLKASISDASAQCGHHRQWGIAYEGGKHIKAWAGLAKLALG